MNDIHGKVFVRANIYKSILKKTKRITHDSQMTDMKGHGSCRNPSF